MLWFRVGALLIASAICAHGQQVISMKLLKNGENSTHAVISLTNKTGGSLMLYGTAPKEALRDGALKDGAKVSFVANDTLTELCLDLRARPRPGRVVTKFSKPQKPVKVPAVPAWQDCWNTGLEKRRYSGMWLKVGDLVRFEVPQTYLTEELFVGTEFSYEWEIVNGYVPDSPRHFAYLDPFDWKELPHSLK